MWVPFELLPEHAKLWVFHAPVPLDEELVLEDLQPFTEEWTAHNLSLPASVSVLDRHFVVLAVDSSQVQASGCSIDKAVHRMSDLGSRLGLDFMEKRRYFVIEEPPCQDRNHQDRFPQARPSVKCYSHQAFALALEQRELTTDSLVANTLVGTKAELKRFWLPLGLSWHRRLFGL